MLFSFLKNSSLLFFCFFSFSSAGKLFRTPYVMFEIEDSWSCKAFGVNWVCHHYLNSNSPPAFIFTTARMTSKSDQLEFDRFEKTESSPSLLGLAKKVSINRHVWIDSFHKDSFYKNVLSRYQRTVCCEDLPEKFQVLVGFHAFTENYPKYSSSFLKVIKSLNLLTEDIEEIRKLLDQQTGQQREDMQNYIQNALFQNSSESSPIKKQTDFSRKLLLIFCLLLSSFVLIFFYIKGRKKTLLKKRSRSRKKK